MPVTILNSTLSQPGLVVPYAGYLYVSLLGDGIRQLDLSGNVVNATWFKSANTGYYTAITVSGNYMYLAWGPNWNQKLAQIKMDNSGNFISVNENFYTNTSGIVDVKGYDANNLFILVNNTSFYLIKIDNSGAFVSATLIFNAPANAFTIYDSKIYILGDNFKNYDFSGNLISTFGLRANNTVRSITIYQNYIYVGYQSAGTDGIIQYNMDGLATDNNIAGQNINGSPYGLCTAGSSLYITTQQSNSLYSAPLPANGTIIPPIIKWTKIDMCYNITGGGGGLVFTGYYSYNSNNDVQSFYSADDLTTNLLIDNSNAFLINLKQRRNFTICNKVTSTGAIDGSRGGCYVKCLPFLKKIFVSEPYLILSGSSISIYDNYGNLTDATATSYVPGSLWGREANGNVYADKNGNFSVGGGWTSRYTTVSMPTVNAPSLPVDDSFFGKIKYLDVTMKYNNNTVLKSYFVYKLDQNNASYLCAVYLYSSVINILLSSDGNCNSFYTTKNFGGNAGLFITSIPSLDAQYASIRAYNVVYDITQLALGVTAYDASGNSKSTINFNGTNLASVRMIGTTENLATQPPPPPPPIQYARMRINYNSILNGNPVGGLVFDGYYSYQTTDNKVVSLYSSSDLSSNLIIPHTDSFVTGAVTLLGKSSSNTAGSTGIDSTSTHAGIFVKNLPFVNALFKSNPYVVLKPSGLVMFDNYGVVNANVLATSYFTNKYVMSNGNVYSNKNNSFFSFSNFTFNYNTVSAFPTVNAPMPIDYTFFNTIRQIKYNAKYNGAVLLDSYFVFYLDSSNNYHMCAQYPTTENKNVLLFSDSACDNFPNTGNFGNTLGTVNPDPTVTTIVAVSGNAATATVTTSTVSATGTPTVTATVTAVGTVAQVNLNALNSNICFSEGAVVTTDQGDVEIQNIDINYHTIRNNKIIALTETQSVDDYLVKIKKNALGNIPTQDTEITGNHMIFNNGFIRAKTLINGTTIEKIPYRGLPLYNILLEQHDTMMVNGLITETLNPENPIAKYYVMMAENPENKIEMENMWRKRTQEIIHA